jgi:hypothetical protein
VAPTFGLRHFRAGISLSGYLLWFEILSAYAEDHACVLKQLLAWDLSAKTGTSAYRHGLGPWMNA